MGGGGHPSIKKKTRKTKQTLPHNLVNEKGNRCFTYNNNQLASLFEQVIHRFNITLAVRYIT